MLNKLVKIYQLSEEHLFEMMEIHKNCFQEVHQENLFVYDTLIKVFPNGAWGAFYNNKLIGYIFFHPYKNQTVKPLNSKLTLKGDEDCMYIHEIAILPQYRSLYIPSQLMKEFDNISKLHHVKYQSLVSVQSSMEFWRKQGFSVIKEVEESYVDGVLMSKNFI